MIPGRPPSHPKPHGWGLGSDPGVPPPPQTPLLGDGGGGLPGARHLRGSAAARLGRGPLLRVGGVGGRLQVDVAAGARLLALGRAALGTLPLVHAQALRAPQLPRQPAGRGGAGGKGRGGRPAAGGKPRGRTRTRGHASPLGRTDGRRRRRTEGTGTGSTESTGGAAPGGSVQGERACTDGVGGERNGVRSPGGGGHASNLGGVEPCISPGGLGGGRGPGGCPPHRRLGRAVGLGGPGT